MTTFRIYVRWPEQRVSDKTTTESRAVADRAFEELGERAEELRRAGALGVTFTAEGKQVEYLRLDDQQAGERT